MALITSLRMYHATPRTALAWRSLFERVFTEARVDVRFIEHGFPQPIEALWSEPGLCCDFMCGWPFVRSERGMQAIAAPIPSLPQYARLPRYRSEFIARDDSGWTSLEESFGHRIGWMAADSQSGFNAPRAFLARHASVARPALFGASRGPYGTPTRTLQALRSGEVDVVALDAYFLDLVRQHAPERLAGLRTIDATPWTPIPLLVAAPGVDRRIVGRLRACLLATGDSPAYAGLLANVLLEGFCAPDAASYRALEAMARSAIERGYESIR